MTAAASDPIEILKNTAWQRIGTSGNEPLFEATVGDGPTARAILEALAQREIKAGGRPAGVSDMTAQRMDPDELDKIPRTIMLPLSKLEQVLTPRALRKLAPPPRKAPLKLILDRAARIFSVGRVSRAGS